MSKLLLLSVLIMLVALPINAARDANVRRGLKRTVLAFVTFNLFYVFALRYLYPRL